MKTVFENIIDGKLACDKVFENENFIAIKDINPKATVHLLIIPKRHFSCLQDVPATETFLLGEAIQIAQQLAIQFGIQDGYRIIINNGKDGGQEVFHLHIHLLGGKVLESFGQ